jgi:hypothetical protein
MEEFGARDASAVAFCRERGSATTLGWQADLAASHSKIGQALGALGDNLGARDMFVEGRAIVAPLAERWGHQLWIGYLRSFDAEIAALEK